MLELVTIVTFGQFEQNFEGFLCESIVEFLKSSEVEFWRVKNLPRLCWHFTVQPYVSQYIGVDSLCLPFRLWWRPGMLAIMMTKGTRYACHLDNKGDQTYLPYQFCLGPDMPAIFSHKDWVCLPYFQNLKSISCKAPSLPVKFDWRKWCAIKRQILWSNRIRPEMNVFYR